jgi:hypothetical protein
MRRTRIEHMLSALPPILLAQPLQKCIDIARDNCLRTAAEPGDQRTLTLLLRARRERSMSPIKTGCAGLSGFVSTPMVLARGRS